VTADAPALLAELLDLDVSAQDVLADLDAGRWTTRRSGRSTSGCASSRRPGFGTSSSTCAG
jgi:hypothetical protein